MTDCEYSHVLIENNLLHDINNTYPLRIYRMGEDVVVRNNLLWPLSVQGRDHRTHQRRPLLLRERLHASLHRGRP